MIFDSSKISIYNREINTTACQRKHLVNTNWYRFKSIYGEERILEDRCLNSTNRCGTVNPGWLLGKHPTIQDGMVKMELKFFFIYCGSTSGTVQVRNCGSFYIYNFISIPFWDCNYGVCTEPFT